MWQWKRSVQLQLLPRTSINVVPSFCCVCVCLCYLCVVALLRRKWKTHHTQSSNISIDSYSIIIHKLIAIFLSTIGTVCNTMIWLFQYCVYRQPRFAATVSFSPDIVCVCVCVYNHSANFYSPSHVKWRLPPECVYLCLQHTVLARRKIRRSI